MGITRLLIKLLLFGLKIVVGLFILLLDIDYIKALPIVLPLILSIAFFTLLERKVLAGIQRRKGPNMVGWAGILQAFADAVKLLTKESIVPSSANSIIFIISPIFIFTVSLLSWAVLPFDYGIVIADLNIGVLFILAISSFGVYGIILSGWASNSKYAFLGSLRSAAQLISYEISMALVIMPVLLAAGNTNLTQIVLAQQTIMYMVPFFPSFILFFISGLAETNRVPFDLPEAESELVAGYHVEYSAVGFVLFFLAEYSNILLMSALIVILFLGGWLPVLGISLAPSWVYMALKVVLVVFTFIWIRGTLPRYRYDQLMVVGWKVILPISIALLFVSINYFIFFTDVTIAQESVDAVCHVCSQKNMDAVCHVCSQKNMDAHLYHMELMDIVLQHCINNHCAQVRFLNLVGQHVSAVPFDLLHNWRNAVGLMEVLYSVQEQVLKQDLPHLNWIKHFYYNIDLWNQQQLLKEFLYVSHLNEQERLLVGQIAITMIDLLASKTPFLQAVGQQVSALSTEQMAALLAVMTPEELLEQIAANVIHKQSPQLYTVIHMSNTLGWVSESNLIKELVQLIPHHLAHMHVWTDLAEGSCNLCGEPMMSVPEGLSKEQFDLQMDELRAKKADNQRFFQEIIAKAREAAKLSKQADQSGI